MTLKQQLAETKVKNIQRMNWLNAKQFKTAEEWEEFHLLKHKYSHQKQDKNKLRRDYAKAHHSEAKPSPDNDDKRDKQGLGTSLENPAPALSERNDLAVYNIGYRKGKASAPAQDKKLREFALWHFNKGRESLMKEVLKIIKEWGQFRCGWADDLCPMIDKDDLIKKLEKLK
jgi:hypothetical protein